MDDVHCAGNETAITQCKHRGWRVTDCDHSKDAGVICTPKGKYTLTLDIYNFYLDWAVLLTLDGVTTASWYHLPLYWFNASFSNFFLLLLLLFFFLVFRNCTRFFFIAFDPCGTSIKWSTGIERWPRHTPWVTLNTGSTVTNQERTRKNRANSLNLITTYNVNRAVTVASRLLCP